MSQYMDEVDREFIETLYPQYLLQQPIAYDLWSGYYKHKKLFHKSNYNKLSNSFITINSKHHKLPYSIKKEIWQKLMHLGVLGTISFDTARDDYLLQVYKYFYPGSNLVLFGNKPGSLKNDRFKGQSDLQNIYNTNNAIDRSIEELAKPEASPANLMELGNTNTSWRNIAENLNNENDSSSTSLRHHPSVSLSFSESVNDDSSDQNDNDEDDMSSNSSSESELNEDEDDDENMRTNEERGQRDDTPQSQDSRRTIAEIEENEVSVNHDEGSTTEAKKSHEEPNEQFYYSNVSSPKIPYQMKTNLVSPDLYRSISYLLPHYWVSQPNNSVLVSSDGISRISPNPNWQSYMKYERSASSNVSTIARNRLRTGIGSTQKYEYAVTWANSSLPLPNLSIFYFEIRVLNVSSSQGGKNSNIIVGYKLSPSSMSRDNVNTNDNNEAISSTVQFIETSQTSSSSRNSNTTGGRNNNSGGGNLNGAGNKNVFDAGFFGYLGFDGSVSAGRQYNTYNEPYGRDDIIGCGINFIDGSIFFTKNGVFLGTAFNDLHDTPVVPAIALRPGNSVRTNFGLYEEFVFDIIGYQNKWKGKGYDNIYKSVNNESDDIESDMEADEGPKDGDTIMGDTEEIEEEKLPDFLLGHDFRNVNGQLTKPDVLRINHLNSNNNSIPNTLNAMINEYLIHEGLIDVAKGFLIDLQRDGSYNDNNDEIKVIRHNEKQIIKEEEMLKVRQELRKLINDRNIKQCIQYIEKQLPGLLSQNVELLFELKLAEYLILILNQTNIKTIILQGQELSATFLNGNLTADDKLKNKFNEQLSNVSALLAYEDPINESPDELSFYLSNEFLQERLYQVINSNVLKYLNKNSDCSLENLVGYTRSMLSTLMTYEGSDPNNSNNNNAVSNKNELRYYKVANIDEDILNI
ncbi:hypothetical protein KAFR_0J02760 [Kazachstania africana CBS 2517]|uniref:B30.2/SPRY domain-containing protein n=1 Tax=Kazachstania africana (strain ATCC 22294 / BCRC 22015 / CBS 2517 / CECT 1963 / NBRC 1671 / NRRL Y-8276) TaxID=1071382 RepID=H2B140_KAZAF|nr:hypothetical protein KAFR_0J02760 [Kazachstania africana CBS 2517]CCF60340.1 hypothetical protein KAFR_0J02760 [Kazachstania africana CBS 2517]